MLRVRSRVLLFRLSFNYTPSDPPTPTACSPASQWSGRTEVALCCPPLSSLTPLTCSATPPSSKEPKDCGATSTGVGPDRFEPLPGLSGRRAATEPLTAACIFFHSLLCQIADVWRRCHLHSSLGRAHRSRNLVSSAAGFTVGLWSSTDLSCRCRKDQSPALVDPWREACHPGLRTITSTLQAHLVGATPRFDFFWQLSHWNVERVSASLLPTGIFPRRKSRAPKTTTRISRRRKAPPLTSKQTNITPTSDPDS